MDEMEYSHTRSSSTNTPRKRRLRTPICRFTRIRRKTSGIVRRHSQSQDPGCHSTNTGLSKRWTHLQKCSIQQGLLQTLHGHYNYECDLELREQSEQIDRCGMSSCRMDYTKAYMRSERESPTQQPSFMPNDQATRSHKLIRLFGSDLLAKERRRRRRSIPTRLDILEHSRMVLQEMNLRRSAWFLKDLNHW